MINAYLYCSYKGSPIGFRIGKIMYELPEDKDYAELSPEGIDGFIRKAFESGIVDEAFDKIISKDRTERYFVMVKQLSYSDPVLTGNASEIYMNFAFEFDKHDEYKRFADNIYSLSKETLAEKAKNFICPADKEPNFALKVNTKEFNAFCRDILERSDNKSKWGNYITEKDNTYIKSRSVQDCSTKINALFGLQDYELEASRVIDDNKLYCISKKKHGLSKVWNRIQTTMQTHPVESIAIAVATGALVVILIKVIGSK